MNSILIIFFISTAFGQQKNELSFDSLEQRAFSTVRIHCGACHIPNQPASNPGALKVFNLSSGIAWYKTMTPGQLLKSEKMLSDRGQATEAELKEQFRGLKERPRKPTLDEIDSYTAFIKQVSVPIFKK